MAPRDDKKPLAVAQLVAGHANPDFDAYASMVAATRLFPGARAVFLGTQNANVREFHTLHEEFLDFVDLRAIDPGAVRRVIMVDTRSVERLGEMAAIAGAPGVERVVYDHHPRAEGDTPDVEDRSMDVGATTSILVHEIAARGVAITPLEASVMLLGIHEDTGSLTYPGTTAYDAEAVTFLMAAGADLEVMDRFLGRALSAAQRRLLGKLMDSLAIWDVHGQKIAVATAVSEEYVDSASVLAHYLSEDFGYRVAVAVLDMPERIQVVGRSRSPEADMGAVLTHLGGGGHPQAAAAGVRDASVPQVLERLRTALDAEVRAPLLAERVMSAPVHSIAPETTMAQAGRLMARWGHGGLPVVEDGRLVGIVTRKDVDKALRHKLGHAPVTGFMAREPRTVGPEADLGELERLLVRTGIGRVPVVRDGAVVGIVTRKDLLRAEHGSAYLDSALERRQAEASSRFLASMKALLPAEVRDAVSALGRLADARGLRAHVVGGFVRDMLLGRRNLDVDVVVEGDGLAFAQAAAAELGGRVRVHRRFGTAVLVLSRTLHVDVTSARTEYYVRPGALPTVERSSLRQDLFRRDFSINAMAVSINADGFATLVDPFGGLHDLERGVLRALHSLSFVEDPTRVLRAARFQVRYGLRIDPSTDALLRQAVEMGMLAEVSGARIREELLDLVDEPELSPILRKLEEADALAGLLPEGSPVTRVLGDVAAVEAAYGELAGRFSHPPRRRIALLVPLVASSAPAPVERWAHWLRFGREYGTPLMATVEQGASVAAALRDGRRMRDSRLHALLAELPAEMLVYLWGTGGMREHERIERFIDVLAGVRLAVSGDDLRELGLAPGPVYSGILAQALADRLDGRAVGRTAELANLRRLVRAHPAG